MKTIFLRNETKKGEQRSPLTPSGVKLLVELGIKVVVETSITRVFSDQEYKSNGAEITNEQWQLMPADVLILGLKELPLSDEPVEHTHIYFAHAFKGQEEAPQILKRFREGGGAILDIEFLKNEDERRVAAFGYWAGYVGAGLGLLGLAHYKKETKAFPQATPFANKDDFIATIQSAFADDLAQLNAMVMGASGRCGTGATDLLNAVGIVNKTLWDIDEYNQSTKPIMKIIEQDIFINCVYLTQDIPAMIDTSLLKQNNRLRVISDVSCDPNSENNPIDVYHSITKMATPFVQADGSADFPVYVQAIDHLPTLLPRESSEEFAADLLPHIIDLCTKDTLTPVWKKALDLYTNIAI